MPLPHALAELVTGHEVEDCHRVSDIDEDVALLAGAHEVGDVSDLPCTHTGEHDDADRPLTSTYRCEPMTSAE